MSSPVSPSTLFSTSPTTALSIIPSKRPETLPAFPIEVQKRILYFALNLTPRYDGSSSQSDIPLSGHLARQNDVRRVVERIGTHRSALNLMRVCKLWKKEAAEYLYTEPHLTPSNLYLFAHALSSGDKKWSDLNLHPVSTPGRYVTSLDLSHLNDGYDTPHPTALQSIIREVFPLIPNLQYLSLPNTTTVALKEIRRAPFARRLKVLQGVSITYDDDDPVVRLLQGLPNLELLSLYGPGNVDTSSLFDDPEEITLDKLHTLVLSSVKAGPVLYSLTAASLPSLRNLVLTSYSGCPGDLTVGFQSSHGEKILNLTYLQPREWPGFRALPPIETGELHPNVQILSYLLPKNLAHLADLLPQQLVELRIPKWTSSPSERWETDPNNPGAVGTGATALMTRIEGSKGRLERIIIDGFRWVRADIGMRALQTGDSGEMRRWAERLRLVGVDLLDMDGKQPLMVNNPIGSNVGRRKSVRCVSDRIDEDGG